MYFEIPDDEDIAKALRAEVTKEQLGMVIEHLIEAIEQMIEMPKEEETEESEMESPENPAPVGDPMKNEVNYPVTKSQHEDEEESDEEISKKYESDNEDEDKWDNVQKACWSGYKQVGMKEKNGRKVPNCVPVKKSIFGTEGPQDLVPKNSRTKWFHHFYVWFFKIYWKMGNYRARAKQNFSGIHLYFTF